MGLLRPSHDHEGMKNEKPLYFNFDYFILCSSLFSPISLGLVSPRKKWEKDVGFIFFSGTNKRLRRLLLRLQRLR